MSLIEYRLDGNIDKVKQSIQRLKAFEPEEGYYIAFSGGKDSVVIKTLADMAGVKYDSHYNVTSVDPPELVNFIREKFPDVSRDIPKDDSGKAITMWNLIPRKLMPPTRLVRYCCEVLKERGGESRVVVTGVRWAESAKRKNGRGVVNVFGGAVLNTDNDEARRTVEQCYRTKKTIVNPIIDWSDSDVWEFIKTEHIPYCGLYDDGFKRLGCIGCPLNQTSAEKELNRWKPYYFAYLKAFERMLAERKNRGKTTQWETAADVMKWWLSTARKEQIANGQIMLDFET